MTRQPPSNSNRKGMVLAAIGAAVSMLCFYIVAWMNGLLKITR